MRYFIYILCLVALFLLSACDKWPPHQQELKADFVEHESDYRLLASMLIDSKYVSVAEYDGTEAYGVFIEQESGSEPAVKGERPPNEEEWLVVLRRSGIEAIERDSSSDVSVFLRKANFNSDLLADTGWEVGFTNDRSLRHTLKQCSDISRDLQCGFCISKLQGDWLVKYFWFPGSSEVFAAYRRGDISKSEAMALVTEDSSECLRENYDASFN